MVHRVKNSDRYYASVAIPGRRTLRVAGFPNKRLTQALERALEQLAALRAQGESPGRELQRYLDGLPERIKRRLATLGLVDRLDDSGQSPFLVDALGDGKPGSAPGDFEQYLLDKGDSPNHAQQQASRARRVLIGVCGFSLISDVVAEPVLQALARLRSGTSGARGNRAAPVSGSTSNMYRQTCRSLTSWLTREGRLPADPLIYLERVRAEARSDRRALTAEEQARLVATTKSQQPRLGLSGGARSVLYVLALQTGLRRGELLSLRHLSFNLHGDSPTVTAEHGHTKNRKTARLPLQPETAAMLRRFLVDALPASPVFRGATSHYRAADALRHDLEAAGIAETTEEGRVDFHALRVTFVTNLARAGVSLAQAQKLARHCDPKLTAGIYSRFGFDEDAAAIAMLPRLAGAVC